MYLSAANLLYSSVFLWNNASSPTFRKFLQFVRKKQNGAASKRKPARFLSSWTLLSGITASIKDRRLRTINTARATGDVFLFNDYLQKMCFFPKKELYANLEQIPPQKADLYENG